MPFQVFCALGFISIFKYFNNLNHLQKKVIFISSFVFILFNMFYYFSSYYFRFPTLYAKQWRSSDMELAYYLKSQEKDYERIIIDENSGISYSSLLFFLAFEPEGFQGNAVLENNSEGFTSVKKFGKYVFKKVDWWEDYKEGKRLIVANTDNKPSQIKPKHIIYLPVRPVAVPKKEGIVIFPYKEVGYEIVESLDGNTPKSKIFE
jgi:hypothetical protein